jgi:hypothetical protein
MYKRKQIISCVKIFTWSELFPICCIILKIKGSNPIYNAGGGLFSLDVPYTYIVVKYKIHLYSLRNRPEKLAILPVSKARTNKFYIYWQCTYILYLSLFKYSSPFINVFKGVFFVVRVTLVPVSYLSVPSTVHSYRVPGKFIRRLKSLFV